MRMTFIAAILIWTLIACSSPDAAQKTMVMREDRIEAGNAKLYLREIGQGQPIVVLHGGPDFDHSYLIPDMDRLAGRFRLIYYDQRGRGKSAAGVQPQEVTLESDVADLDKIREHLQLESIALLGHSWGALLALEYAIRHPQRVSHLLLMNPAPVSRDDFLLLRKDRFQKLGDDLAKLKAISATAAYKEGDPDTVAAYYRIHFAQALKEPQHRDEVIARLRASFTKEGILRARAVEDRLMQDTWLTSGYDILPKLANLRIPALVLYGDHDFIPEACAAHIAGAMPGARMVTLKACGHFAYLECPDAVREGIDRFFRTSRRSDGAR